MLFQIGDAHVNHIWVGVYRKHEHCCLPATPLVWQDGILLTSTEEAYTASTDQPKISLQKLEILDTGVLRLMNQDKIR